MVMTDAKTCGATFVSNVGGSPAVNRAAPVLTTPPARPTAADAVATAPQPPAAPIGQEQHAKEEIGRLVNDYCQALQTLTADKLQPLFSVSNAPSKENFERSFAQYRTLKCALAPEPPEFVMLDAREQQGEGKLKFKMTQDVQMRNGRPSRRIHTLVTMVVSRRSYQSPWLIDRVTHEPLPK
jgi:hypothetical protein